MSKVLQNTRHVTHFTGNSHFQIYTSIVNTTVLVNRAGSAADVSFWYPASVKPYRFRYTEKNYVLVYPNLITERKICENKTLTVHPKDINIEVLF